jgi:hypothetical protein
MQSVLLLPPYCIVSLGTWPEERGGVNDYIYQARLAISEVSNEKKMYKKLIC